MSTIVWLQPLTLEAIHLAQLSEHGGAVGIRDRGLLETALAKPHQLASYGDPPPDLCDLAAAYAHGIAHLHPFVDGNKRTSLLALYTFLGVNGVDFIVPEAEAAAMILALAAGEVNEDGLVRWIRDNWPSQ